MTTNAIARQWKTFLVRIILPPLLTIVLFLAAMFFYIIPAIERNSLEHKKEMIRELTNAAWNILSRFADDEQRGLLTRAEAQRQALRQIGSLHYGQQMRDYFWINDMAPRMILHPYRADLNGSDLADYTDAAGKKVFREVVEVVQKHGAGYVDYQWQWDNDQTRIVPKLSYVKGFAPWGWVLGTGIYIQDVRDEVALMTRSVVIIALLIFCIMALLLSVTVVQGYRTEQQYRTIFETTGTATVISEQDMTISLVNSKFEELSGYAKPDVEGIKKLTDFVHPDDIGLIEGYHHLRRARPAAAPRTYEFRCIDRTGCLQHILMTVALIPGTQKSVASFLDMTGYKQALQVVAESEQRFRSLVENALTGIFIVQDEQIVYYNPEQERLFGPIPPGFKITATDKIYAEDIAKVRQFYRRIMSGEAATLDIDYRFYSMATGATPAGIRWAYCRASLIEYQGRKAVLVNMMDVTRAKELERLLGIKDKMVSLGHVAAGIAHEIRNPLSGINVFLDGIRENFQDPESSDDIKGLITQAQAAAGKIESVVKGVLDFARPSTPHFELTDITAPLRDALRLSHVTQRKAGISVVTDLQEGLPPVYIDKHQMEQVIMNLITNAAESLSGSAGERRIDLQTYADQDSVVIRCADSGCGIRPESREKIFDPFYTTKKDGSGIGLSICERIIADHRGSISVGSSPSGGAEFIIRIPRGSKG